MAPRPATAAVFLREARRQARRWQTYALRMVVAAFVFAAMGVLSVSADLTDPAKSADFGRTMFMVYSYTQLTMVGLLAPLMVGLGVAEERDEGTLQLLVITRLSTLQILWGKVISRLLVLMSFVIGGLPVLALVASFGGVGPWEVLHVTGNTLLVALVLGTIGGVAALFSGGGAVALGAAALWALLNWLLLPLAAWALMANGGGDPTDTMSLFSPPAAMLQSGWRGFAPMLTNLPVIAILVGLTTPLFGLVTSRTVPTLEGSLHNDDELAGVARLQRRVGVLALLVPVFAAATIAAFTVRHNAPWLDVKAPAPWIVRLSQGHIDQLAFEQLSQGLTVGTVVMMMMLSAAAIALTQLRISAIVKQVLGGSGSGLLASALRAFDAVVRPVRLPVWPLPVTWRELATRGGGGPFVLARWLALPLIGLSMFFICIGVSANAEDGLWALGSLILLTTYILTILLGISTFSTERQRRTLPLLVQTTHSMPKLVLGKLLAVGLTVAPWLGVGLMLVLLGSTGRPMYGADWGYAETCSFPAMGQYVPLYDGLSHAIWALGAWWFLLGLSLVAGLRSRPARVAFPVVISFVIAAPVLLLAGLLFFGSEDLAQAALPMFNAPSRWRSCHGDWRTIAVGVALMGAGTTLMVALLVRARAWILADGAAS